MEQHDCCHCTYHPRKLFETYNMHGCKPKFTPAPTKYLVSNLDCPPKGADGADERAFMADKPFREAVGDLLWISRIYRYDITHAVNALSRVAHNPGRKHWDALQHLLQYVHHTRNFRLVFRKSSDPTAVTSYSDSDWMPDYGDEYDNYRSTTGNITNAAGNPIMWRSRRQDRLAVSVNEAEYYAAAEAAKAPVNPTPNCSLYAAYMELICNLNQPQMGPT